MPRVTLVTPWIGTGTQADPNRPLLQDAHPAASWLDATGQPTEHLAVSKDAYTIEAECDEATLAVIAADIRFAVLWTQADGEDTAPVRTDPAVLKGRLAGMGYYNDVVTLVVDEADDPATALIEAQRRPPHEVGKAVAVGDVVQYQGNLYRCVRAHTTQADWTPNVTPALWVRFHEPDSDPWPWVQPQGAHDAIPIGQRRTHDGGLWVVTQGDASGLNSWAPGVFGWERLSDWPLGGAPDPEPDEYPAWKPWTGHNADLYQVGDRVTHPDRANTMGTGADTVWVWRSKIDANTTEPGQDGQFHRWWEPIEQA